MNQTLIDLVDTERKRQDSMPGNTNNHSDPVWTSLVVKQLGQVIGKNQDVMYWNNEPGVNPDYVKELMRERKKHMVNATALMVAWLEDLVQHEPLE